MQKEFSKYLLKALRIIVAKRRLFHNPMVIKYLMIVVFYLGYVAQAKASLEEELGEGIFITDKLPSASWPAWIEGADNTILMSVHLNGKIYIASSKDEGESWRIFSKIEIPGESISSAYSFSWLPKDILLFKFQVGDKLCWVKSSDNGYTWSAPVLIASGFNSVAAPIRVMSDGSWANTLYTQEKDLFTAYIIRSKDQGKTWEKPVAIHMPTDGNKGTTESDIIEVSPNNYVAAIRADEGIDGAWDGFYFSWSESGDKWSVPTSLCERGRMPIFYKLGNLWALSYRLYDFAFNVQHSAIRFSLDGKEWSPPMIIEDGVNAASFLVQVNGKIIAFNTLYSERTKITRKDITELVKKVQRYENCRQKNNVLNKSLMLVLEMYNGNHHS